MQQDSWKENREKRSVINRPDGKKSSFEHIYICFLKTIVNPFGVCQQKVNVKIFTLASQLPTATVV